MKHCGIPNLKIDLKRNRVFSLIIVHDVLYRGKLIGYVYKKGRDQKLWNVEPALFYKNENLEIGQTLDPTNTMKEAAEQLFWELLL